MAATGKAYDVSRGPPYLIVVINHVIDHSAFGSKARRDDKLEVLRTGTAWRNCHCVPEYCGERLDSTPLLYCLAHMHN